MVEIPWPICDGVGMFHGILSLVNRSIRIDARSWLAHAARMGLILATYLALLVILREWMLIGAPGLRYFQWIAYLNFTFMSILGISYFSTPITEEKEEDTLGLMLMAGISPLGILVGKSGGRLIQALLIVAVQYPFLRFAITLGGVLAHQVNAVYLGLSSYLIFLAGFGLLCSTLSSNNRVAATRMIIGIAAYIMIPMLAAKLITTLGLAGLGRSWLGVILNWITEFSAFQQLGQILLTASDESVVSFQVISNLLVGCGCFLLSWCLFGLATRSLATESETRGAVTVQHGRLALFSPGRPWSNPFFWKDFYFIAGGFGMIPLRLAFATVLWIVVAYLNPMHQISAYQVFLSLALVIDAGRMLSSSLHAEVRGQTLASLIMLPRSSTAILYSKFAGALIGILPLALIDLCVSLGTEQGFSNARWVLTHPDGFAITGMFLLIPNVSAVLSLYLRWGAVSVGTALSFGFFFVASIAFDRIHELEILLALATGVISGLCHLVIGLRFHSLAERT